jgi:T1SS-143 domain-containing protein
VDQDGDPAQATLTVTVSDLDTEPCVANSEKTVDETALDDAGVQTVNGTLSVDYRADGPGTTAPVAGSFAAGGSLAGGALTSNGVPVVVTLTGDTYTGKAGTATVFTLKVNTDGTYQFKLLDQLDHADKTNPDDVINLGFGFKATDTDGDAASGTITIHVKDDGPVAVNDVATLSSAPGSVTGNVVTNDDVGADEPGFVVTKVTFGSSTVSVPATGTVVVAGAHGTLSIDHTGAYTYQGASVGSDAFTYTIVDQDGDPAQATLTVTVSDLDTEPCVANSEKTVDETALDDAGVQTVNGTLSVDYRADGPGTTAPVAGSFAAGGSLAGGALTSNGVPVVVTLTGDTYTGKAGTATVFTLKVNTDGTYQFKLLDQLDHADKTNPDDVINLGFGFKATDTDGDAASGTITIHVKDDGPVAVNDVATLSSAPGSVTGNVVTNDDVGADEPGFVVTKVTFGSSTVSVPATGTVVVAGAHGTLSIDHTGAYTYQGASVGSDAFTYTIVDQDGDPAQATLTVTVSDLDTEPCVANSEKTVDETALDDAGVQTVNGTLSVDYRADGPGTTAPVAGSFAAGGSLAGGALTSNGVPVVVTLTGDTYTGKAGTATVFTLKVNTDGTYQFKLLDQLDHADKTNPDDVINLGFGFKATDTDGDVASGTITIHVKDDGPVAVNDSVTVLASQSSATGNVMANDNIGADEPGYGVTAIKFGGMTYAVPTVGTVTVSGAYGALVIASSGTYVYTPTTTGKGGLDQFTYTIVDQDGDPATAVLGFQVSDRFTPPEKPCLTVCDACVFEDHGVQLALTAKTTGGDGDETMVVTISGFKPGWLVDTSLSGGSYNAVTGVWTVNVAAGKTLSMGPAVFPPPNSDADLTGLVVKAVVTDPDSGLTSQASGTMNVVTDAVADAPNLIVSDSYVFGDEVVNLSIATSLKDTDGSEVIKEIRVDGLPSGVNLNAGVYDSINGYWVLTPAQLTGLKIVAPDGYHGAFDLVVTSVSEEKNLSGTEKFTDNNLAYATQTLNITITADGSCGCGDQTQTQTTVVNNTVVINNTNTVTITNTFTSSSSNTYVIDVQEGQNALVISDFDAGEGDILDLSNLIQQTDAVTQSIQDFVHSREEAGSTVVSVDADGSGTQHEAYDVVVLQGVTGVRVEDIVQITQQQQNQSGTGTI